MVDTVLFYIPYTLHINNIHTNIYCVVIFTYIPQTTHICVRKSINKNA